MKTTTTTTRTALLTAWILISSLCFAQQVRQEDNWLQAWKAFAGNQCSATWLHNEMANGATLYTDTDHDVMVLKADMDWTSIAEMESALEEGIQAGNGNQMLAAGASESMSPNTAVNFWNGQIGGRQLHATAIAHLQGNGQGQLIIRLSTQPLHEDATIRNERALALLDQVAGESLLGTWASEHK